MSQTRKNLGRDERLELSKTDAAMNETGADWKRPATRRGQSEPSWARPGTRREPSGNKAGTERPEMNAVGNGEGLEREQAGMGLKWTGTGQAWHESGQDGIETRKGIGDKA